MKPSHYDIQYLLEKRMLMNKKSCSDVEPEIFHFSQVKSRREHDSLELFFGLLA